MLLSPDDKDLESFKYDKGNLFTSNKGNLLRIKGLVITKFGKIVYLMEKYNGKGYRFISPLSLDKGYSEVSLSKARFMFLE